MNSIDRAWRRVAASLVAVTLPACQAQVSPAEAFKRDVAEHNAYVERRRAEDAAREAKIRDAEKNLADISLAPLREFLKNPKAPCSAEAARKAKRAALSGISVASGFDFQTKMRSGVTALEVADGLKGRGCKADARELYQTVINVFVGSGFAGLRDRAKIGIDDLRG